jgi:hypothetical protein
VAVKPSRPGLGIGLQHLDFQCMGMIETKIWFLHPPFASFCTAF